MIAASIALAWVLIQVALQIAITLTCSAIALRVFWMPRNADFTLQATSDWRFRRAVVFAVDIADFTAAERDDEVQLALRDALYRVLIDAFDAAGVAWEQCLVEDRGDGVLVTMPAQLPIATVIDLLLIFLGAGLRRHNRLSREVAHIHLRAALHVGDVHRDAHGVAGNTVNLLFRLLDALVLKEALISQGTEVVLIVSDQMYEQAVRRNPELVNPPVYRPVIAATKKTRARAWIRTATADCARR